MPYGTVDELIKRVSVLIKGLDQPGSTVYPGGSWLASLGSVARIDRTTDVVGVYDTYAGSGETAIRSGMRTPVNDPMLLIPALAADLKIIAGIVAPIESIPEPAFPVICPAADNPQEQPGSMEGPTSHSYFSQRLRLHYVDWGNEGAPPMLMVHGGRDHCRNWDWVAQAFRDDYHIIAPDLRGHGDSQWAVGSSYHHVDYVYDIAQLIHQKKMNPVTIVAHSMGGGVSLTYAGLYPATVAKLVAIEGMGPPPKMVAEWADLPIHERLDTWVQDLRKSSGRLPRRYATLEEAHERMQTENPHLTEERARHLTIHGSNQNEDGTFSWKFDNYVRNFSPVRLPFDAQHALWSRISCPTLLVRGSESWSSDRATDGRADHFQDAQVVNIDGAGHWAHHDQLDEFLTITRSFLAD